MRVEPDRPQDQTMEQEVHNPQDPQRREALVTSGKYAAYTAPAMLSLLLPRQGKAQLEPPSPPP